MRNRFCIACDKALTGKQRKYCSNVCRNRLNRWKDRQAQMSENEQKSSDSERKSSAYERKSSGNGYESSGNYISIVVYIDFKDNDRSHEWDGFTLKTMVKQELEAYLSDLLEDSFPDWTFGAPKTTIKRH